MTAGDKLLDCRVEIANLLEELYPGRGPGGVHNFILKAPKSPHAALFAMWQKLQEVRIGDLTKLMMIAQTDLRVARYESLSAAVKRNGRFPSHVRTDP